MNRKLFLDSVSIEEAKQCIDMGIVDGVTTNPSLFSKQPKGDFISHCQELAQVCNGLPLSVEIFCDDPDLMFEEALKIYGKIDYSGLNIKIPIGVRELSVIRKLSKLNIAVNCTCCFTYSQMLMAAKAGSRYVSLFYNRALDRGEDSNQILEETNNYIFNSNLDCEIISGSIRKSSDVTTAWFSGSHIVTASMDIIKDMCVHEGTTESVNGFLEDFREWIS